MPLSMSWAGDKQLWAPVGSSLALSFQAEPTFYLQD